MADLIDRQAAIDAFEKFIHEIGIEDAPYNYGEIALCEANVPTEEKVGKWIEVDDDRISGKCSVCGWEAHLYEDDVVGMPYCPNCGARMEGEEK